MCRKYKSLTGKPVQRLYGNEYTAVKKYTLLKFLFLPGKRQFWNTISWQDLADWSLKFTAYKQI